jgi:hypothetical protein
MSLAQLVRRPSRAKESFKEAYRKLLDSTSRWSGKQKNSHKRLPRASSMPQIH